MVMQAQINASGDPCTVRLSQALTFEDHKAFKRLIEDIAKSGKSRWVFDLGGLQNVDSAGLGMLLFAHEQSQQQNWSFVVTGSHGQVQQMLELTQLGHVLTIQ